MAVVGIVGLGLLGHAIASRLIAAGHRVVGHDVVADRVAAVVALGGKGASSASQVAAGAEAVCTVLPSLAVVEHAILGPGGVLAGSAPGQPVIQMSTISPALTERLASAAAERGRAFLDCPVSGTSAQVARGEGILMVGGDRALYERWRPVLESILPRSFHVGSPGQAMLLKLVANLLIAVHSAAAAEALALARKGGLDPARALAVLAASAATSRMLEVRGPLVVRDEFPPQMKLDLFMKDLRLIQDAARAAGAAVPLADTAERLYAEAMAGGHGGEDLSVVARVLAARPPAAR
jgi:3-hydroxyisobutyrate dehydrogenase-like beta-hydroxyacid dehydrogenase